ncbi:unnamed protein product [Mucor hiemalis]
MGSTLPLLGTTTRFIKEKENTSSRYYNHCPYFEFDEFLINLNSFTCNNLLSIWLWKRFNTTFFKKDILYNMTNHNETNIGFFRPILDTQQKALLAWDRQVVPQNGAFLGLTETVLLHNTELFGRLL